MVRQIILAGFVVFLPAGLGAQGRGAMPFCFPCCQCCPESGDTGPPRDDGTGGGWDADGDERRSAAPENGGAGRARQATAADRAKTHR